jgi:hypothetical protein
VYLFVILELMPPRRGGMSSRMTGGRWSSFSARRNKTSVCTSTTHSKDELDRDSVVKYSLTTAEDGKTYRTLHYNLDVIISVGYRVK